MKHEIGLIGHPVSHSKSPEIFRDFFLQTPKQQWNYQLWDLHNIDALNAIVKSPNIRGFNVTLPHKTNIIPYLNFIAADAYRMQSVNTVICLPKKEEPLNQLRFLLQNLQLSLLELNSQFLPPSENDDSSEKKLNTVINTHYLIGFNTDILGFEDSVNSFNKPFNQAVIIGNGGSSKSVKQLLSNKGIPFLHFSRTPDYTSSVHSMAELQNRKPSANTLWVNTSPAGMLPNVNSMPDIPEFCIHPTDSLIDLIYNPEETKLMQHFQQQGAQTRNGWIMLTSQAKHAWNLFQLSAKLSITE